MQEEEEMKSREEEEEEVVKEEEKGGKILRINKETSSALLSAQTWRLLA